MPDQQSTAPERLQICSFRLGSLQVGVPVAELRELTTPQGLVAVDGAPAHLAGLLYFRGQILTVLDLWILLDQALNIRPLTPQIAVLQAGNKQCGLLVDEVGEVAEIPLTEFESLPAGVVGPLRSLCRQFHAASGLLLLESERLFSSPFPPAG